MRVCCVEYLEVDDDHEDDGENNDDNDGYHGWYDGCVKNVGEVVAVA